MDIELTIEELGAQGDGIARHDGTRVFVPYTLPGERVTARLVGESRDGARADLVALLSPSPDRIAPPCSHFGTCGGCAVQHLESAAYAAWKTGRIVRALEQRGVPLPPIAPLVAGRPETRRRARLAAARNRAGLGLGFRAAASRRVVDIRSCALLTPRLQALMAPLRALLAERPPQGGHLEISLTEVDGAIDLWLDGRLALDIDARQRLVAFAEAQDLARLSVGGTEASGEQAPEPVVIRRPVRARFADVAVDLPVGGFLQPTAAGEAAIAAATTAALEGAGRVADLYAGCGALSFPLARAGAKVLAVELDAAMGTAMLAAARASGMAVEVARRDLSRAPLRPDELSRFDAVVFDPPRTGARAQAEALAASTIERVVAVSCNPATFARDARILIDGGFRLAALTPLDQFLWSPHVELIARFAR